MAHQDLQKTSDGNTGKMVAIGCGVVFVVAIAAAFIVYFSVKKAVLGYVEDFTATEAVQLAKPAGSKEDAQTVIARFNAFIDALENGKETEPLALTGNEINQLIYFHPRWKGLSDKARMSIDGSEIAGKISLPLDEMAVILESLKGRYLNGSATFTVGLMDGRALVFLKSLEVNEKTVPETFMTSLRAENLVKDANADPDFQQQIRNLDSITVEDDKLIIVAKPVAERPPPDPAP